MQLSLATSKCCKQAEITKARESLILSRASAFIPYHCLVTMIPHSCSCHLGIRQSVHLDRGDLEKTPGQVRSCVGKLVEFHYGITPFIKVVDDVE